MPVRMYVSCHHVIAPPLFDGAPPTAHQHVRIFHAEATTDPVDLTVVRVYSFDPKLLRGGDLRINDVRVDRFYPNAVEHPAVYVDNSVNGSLRFEVFTVVLSENSDYSWFAAFPGMDRESTERLYADTTALIAAFIM